MKTVTKYGLSLDHGPRVVLEMPAGSEVIKVAPVGAELFLWALGDTSQPQENRPFVLAPTGLALADRLGEHLGTAIMFDGELVVHVFDGRPNPYQESF